MTKRRILVIDDDYYFRLLVKEQLEGLGVIIEASEVSSAKKSLEYESIDFAIIDLNLNHEKEGLEVLSYATQKGIPSIMLTDFDDPNIIKECYSKGAVHYLTKSNSKVVLREIVQKELEKKSIINFEKIFSETFITKNNLLRKEIQTLPDRITECRPILILGESGTGKGVLANLIHEILSSFDMRKREKFIDINVSAIPEALAESELFGHEKGSFTGASGTKKGKLELAHEGTLFLDEISTAKLSLQYKLLKALEDKRFFPVGGNHFIHSNFQLITATSENLYELVRQNIFRSDLFYRINAICIELLPLRKRKEDIPLLVERFLKVSSRRVFIENDAMDLLVNYSWPGNVRELKTVIENLAHKSNGIVTVTDIPTYMIEERGENNLENIREQFLTEEQINFLKNRGLKSFLSRVELEAINEVMELNGYRAYEAAKALKISKTNMYRLLKKGEEP